MPDVVIKEINVRPQPDGRTEYDLKVPLPPMMQEVKIVVNRGKGEEVFMEKD